jgi:myo-inositol-1-phosphate synthase
MGNPKRRPKERVGLWLIGACGGVGSTVALGLAAIRAGLNARTGLVTDLQVFDHADLVDPAGIVVGGHEIRDESLWEAVQATHQRANVFDESVLKRCKATLFEFQRNIVSGTLLGAGRPIRNIAHGRRIPDDRSIASTIERLAEDIATFRRRHGLSEVVVINVASSEPPFKPRPEHRDFEALRACLSRKTRAALPTSSIYALAAIECGCAYVNFTPSCGISPPALRRRAIERGVPYFGNDGKTGETLIKSVLAPMFAMRHLKVLSWVGQNILGNRDGAVLSDPGTRESKLRSKDRIVSQMFGPTTTTRVGIEFVPSLDDWKVAWDYIHFEGFLGTKMNLQFTWCGSDSVLAAPLVIDLARLSARELRDHHSGPMKHLAFFFKDPIGVDEHDLFSQWIELVHHAMPHDHQQCG